jgi:hypothetical protein
VPTFGHPSKSPTFPPSRNSNRKFPCAATLLPLAHRSQMYLQSGLHHLQIRLCFQHNLALFPKGIQQDPISMVSNHHDFYISVPRPICRILRGQIPRRNRKIYTVGNHWPFNSVLLPARFSSLPGLAFINCTLNKICSKSGMPKATKGTEHRSFSYRRYPARTSHSPHSTLAGRPACENRSSPSLRFVDPYHPSSYWWGGM